MVTSLAARGYPARRAPATAVSYRPPQTLTRRCSEPGGPVSPTFRERTPIPPSPGRASLVDVQREQRDAPVEPAGESARLLEPVASRVQPLFHRRRETSTASREW